MLIHQLLLDGAMRRPERIAWRWVDRDRALVYAEAAQAMERMAGALTELGVGKGDRVTIFAHNGLDYLVAMFGTWRIGAIAALVNVKFANELPYYFADHESSVVIYTHDMAETVRQAAAASPSIRHLVCMDGPQEGAHSLPDLMAAGLAPAPDPWDEDAIAHLSYTSGTTGKPKGACLRHEPTVRATYCIAERLRIGGEDVSFGPTALSSSYQLVANLMPRSGGWRPFTLWVGGRRQADTTESRRRARRCSSPTRPFSRRFWRNPAFAERRLGGFVLVSPAAVRAAHAQESVSRPTGVALGGEFRPERTRRLHGAWASGNRA